MRDRLHGKQLRFLFTSWEGGGNIPPMLGAIRALVERGHRVLLLCDQATSEDGVASGAEVQGWRRAPNRKDRTRDTDLFRPWEAASEIEEFARVRDCLFVGPAESYARDTLDAIAAFQPDVVVPNDMLFGAIIGAEAARKPTAIFSANLSLFPMPEMPPLGPGFFPARTSHEQARDSEVHAGTAALMNAGLPKFNETRASLNLPPLTSLMEVVKAADRILLATSAAFDYPVPTPPQVRYVGPFLDQPGWAVSQSARAEDTADVLIAFSTTYQAQEKALSSAIEAMRGLPLRAVVTLGPSLEHTVLENTFKKVPDNVSVLSAASHDALLDRARVVITHAGHGTVMRALSHGTPLLCLPMGRDQNDNAARVSFHGAGLRLPRTATHGEIREALQQIVSDPAFAAGALRLQKAISAENAPARLSAELEALAAGREMEGKHIFAEQGIALSSSSPR